MDNCINPKKNKFNIQGLTRLNEDSCYKNLRNKTISRTGKYNTRNFKNCDCLAPEVKELSLQHPSVFFRDGYGWSSNNGCNIDNDSKLRNAKNLTNERCINQLMTRPYSTTPYMGRGEGNVIIENKLLPGESTVQNRPCNNLSGIYIDRFIPQIPCIKREIQNTKNIIPEDTDNNWVRGGQPSRQIIRNKDYLKNCGYKYNGKFWKR
jgi:hypothetical protein|uniref:Uncharacterized protein n=1 Tax=viral metagenome TaxID=1070528 RepID=A0A6C0LXE4_9ZZZZ